MKISGISPLTEKFAGQVSFSFRLNYFKTLQLPFYLNSEIFSFFIILRMDDLPDLLVKKILEFLPRRLLEDVIVNVSSLWRFLGNEILSENVRITDFCNLPPGFDDDLDLSLTRWVGFSKLFLQSRNLNF